MLPVDLASVPNPEHNHVIAGQRIDDSVVSDSQPQQAFELACKMLAGSRVRTKDGFYFTENSLVVLGIDSIKVMPDGGLV